MRENCYIDTVRAFLGDAPAIDVPQAEIERSLRELAHGQLWMDYDADNDSLVMSFTGQPVAGLHVPVGDDHHVILDPSSHRVMGLYLEHVICPDSQTPRR